MTCLPQAVPAAGARPQTSVQGLVYQQAIPGLSLRQPGQAGPPTQTAPPGWPMTPGRLLQPSLSQAQVNPHGAATLVKAQPPVSARQVLGQIFAPTVGAPAA